MIFLFFIRLLGTILIAYIFMITLRILLSWFGNAQNNRFFTFLCKATDPYLSLFRNIRLVNTAGFNYAPLVGIAILIILSNILITIAATGTIRLTAILAIIITTVSSALFWIIIIFIGLTLVRFFFLAFNKSPHHMIWPYIDSLLQPVLKPILRLFRDKPDYQKLLISTALVFTAVLITGFFLMDLLLKVIRFIPF